MPSGKAIGFKPLVEEWNYYSIDDGFVMGIRTVVTKVLKTAQVDPTGNPVYIIQVSQPVMQVLTQEEYKLMTSRGQITK